MKRKLVVSVGVGVLAVAAYLMMPFLPLYAQPATMMKPKEIKAILATTDMNKRAEQYRALIVRVGAAQAQEDLLHSGLPFDGQTHLLNHTVGEYLFDTQGMAGLSSCKEYFLASCYHGFLENIISNNEAKTIENLKIVMMYCDKKGGHLAVQCSHAIGHSLLATSGYENLPTALKRCDDVAAAIPLMPAYNCYDGVFMENIWGVHTGMPSPQRWVNPYDPKFPCDDTRIQDKYIQACWGNQPSEMYMIYNSDSAMVGYVCSTLDKASLKKTCYDALARQLISVANGDINKMFSLCQTLTSDQVESCLQTMVIASFSVGDRSAPFQICKRDQKDRQTQCYGALISMVQFFASSAEDQKRLCSRVVDDYWRVRCEDLPFDKTNLPKS